MSVRAYRIINIERAESSSFNLWQDSELVNFLNAEQELYSSLDSDGCGVADVPVESLERALEALKLDDEVREALQKDIEAAHAAGDEYVQYYCL